MPAGGPNLQQQISELNREVSLRQQGIPRAGSKAQQTPSQEAHGMACLQAALATLVAVRDGTLPPRSGE